MRYCSNCGTTHAPLKRYIWNINHNFDFKEERIGKETQRKGNPGYKSESGLLCDACAMKKGAWQLQGQEDSVVVEIHVAPELNEEEQQFFVEIHVAPELNEEEQQFFDEINSIIEHRQS